MKKYCLLATLLMISPLAAEPPDPNQTIPNVEKYLNPERVPGDALEDLYPQGLGADAGGPGKTTLGAQQSASQAQAVAWLVLLDQGQFPASYGQTDSLFQAVISRKVWIAAMNALRKDQGQLRSRTAGKTKQTSSFGGIEGNYVTLNFESDFSRSRRKIKETVTLTDRSGQWKVIAYAIQ